MPAKKKTTSKTAPKPAKKAAKPAAPPSASKKTSAAKPARKAAHAKPARAGQTSKPQASKSKLAPAAIASPPRLTSPLLGSSMLLSGRRSEAGGLGQPSMSGRGDLGSPQLGGLGGTQTLQSRQERRKAKSEASQFGRVQTQFEATSAKKIQTHIASSVRRSQARRDSKG